MAARTPKTERRTDALSKAKIVEAAIAILDADGESALTCRALATRLATGSGAIYWHLADKNDLLGAATDEVIGDVIGKVNGGPKAKSAIKAIGLGIFDAIDAHPWVAAQLFREPWRPAMLLIFESVGGPLEALGVAETARFDTASALVNYILGVAGQNAANARLARETQLTDRAAFLATVADRWSQLDPARYPFVRRMAPQLRDHDDRKQFLVGLDLILAGVGSERGDEAPAADK